MNDLAGKKILLGLTGGIAAYKTAELLRLLTGEGADVQVVMTKSACEFITPVTMQALSGKPVYTGLWDTRVPNGMPHIDLSRDADCIIVAPASANFMAKIANGLCDDLLSTLCIARRAESCPLLLAPAMNLEMWENPATQRNVKQLRDDGVYMMGPDAGDQACGETGMGRMSEPETLLAEVIAFFQSNVLAGKRVLITAGPTFEKIDPVRGITNFSSGKMGYAVARAAAEAGAAVTLISGPVELPVPLGVTRIFVESAREMHAAVMAQAKNAEIFIAVAAVADYHVTNSADHKLKKNGKPLTIDLALNPDILGDVAKLPKPPFCVGFAAETQNLHEYAEAKRRDKKIPLLVANLAQHAFGGEDNHLVLFDDAGEHDLPRASKLKLARQLVAHIATLINKGK